MLLSGASDPLLSFLLTQNAAVKQHWEMVQALACRCRDAYEEGRSAAHQAFPHFPRHRFNALHQEHLAHLSLTWRYNTHAGSAESQKTYPGYTPESEQSVMLRWFRRGYMAGAVEDGAELRRRNTQFTAQLEREKQETLNLRTQIEEAFNAHAPLRLELETAQAELEAARQLVEK